MYLMRNHDVWIYVRCANSDPRIAFDRLYDLIDEAAVWFLRLIILRLFFMPLPTSMFH